jgi:short-subunit dehydrogenase
MNKFGIVTGASSGIGLELARIAAGEGYDLLLAADTPFPGGSAGIEADVDIALVEEDLATIDGVDRLLASARNRPIDLLCANAGHGLGHAFLEQPVEQWRHVIETNVTGTVYLLQQVLRQMTRRNSGKVLVTGSIAGVIPGSYQAVYNGSKAFVNSFAAALREELKDFDGVQITTLMPGATETEFFHRANMDDTKVGQMKKDDAADVARTGWEALMKGRDDVVHGLKNKLQAAAAHLLPEGASAAMHTAQAKPKGEG